MANDISLFDIIDKLSRIKGCVYRMGQQYDRYEDKMTYYCTIERDFNKEKVEVEAYSSYKDEDGDTIQFFSLTHAANYVYDRFMKVISAAYKPHELAMKQLEAPPSKPVAEYADFTEITKDVSDH